MRCVEGTSQSWSSHGNMRISPAACDDQQRARQIYGSQQHVPPWVWKFRCAYSNALMSGVGLTRVKTLARFGSPPEEEPTYYLCGRPDDESRVGLQFVCVQLVRASSESRERAVV